MIQTKRCPKCGETKPVDGFYRNRSRVDGLTKECKTCVNTYQKAYQQSEITNMTDRYIGSLLRVPLSKIPPEFIALKRAEIQLQRQLKEMK